MQVEFFQRISESLSVERLSSYGRLDAATPETILARYLWNLAICESLYSPVQLCEVSLRNTLHHYLTDQFGERWYDSGALKLTVWGANEVARAKEKLRRMKRDSSPGRVVAELTFGFWTHLFQSDYIGPSGFLPRGIKAVFPNLEKSMHKPKQIKHQLDRIRDLRNRIFHHERVIHWKDLEEKHSEMLEVIRWSRHELYELAKTLDRFTEIHSAGIEPWKGKLSHH
jgi:hypothetical protein